MKQLTDREQAIVRATIRIWNFNLRNGYVPDCELISNSSELPLDDERDIRDLVQEVHPRCYRQKGSMI